VRVTLKWIKAVGYPKFVHLLKYEFYVTNPKQVNSYLTVNTISPLTQDSRIMLCRLTKEAQETVQYTVGRGDTEFLLLKQMVNVITAAFQRCINFFCFLCGVPLSFFL